MLQIGKFKETELPGTYQWVEDLEKTLRTGEYRHKMITFERILDEIDAMGK
jgi:hypothetical protein